VPLAKREMLAAVFEFSSRREGDEFYNVGQQNKCFYVVCQGEVEIQGERGEALRTLKQGLLITSVSCASPSTRQSCQNVANPPILLNHETKKGMFFGERALLSNDFRTETAVALGPGSTVCVALTRDGFERFLESAPELRAGIKVGFLLKAALLFRFFW